MSIAPMADCSGPSWVLLSRFPSTRAHRSAKPCFPIVTWRRDRRTGPKIGGGRMAAREILLSIPAISNLIREGKTFQIPSIMQTNRKSGMITLNDALIELVDQGLVEAKEAYMKAVEKAGFAQALKAKRHDVTFLSEG